jgi:hypothetical protein
MRISVEEWSPEYGGELDLGGPEELTAESVDTEVEGRAWGPVDPAASPALATRPLAFVDGTRRIDARLYLSLNGERPLPGIAASVGVGAVVCDPAPGGRDGRRGPRWWIPRRARVDAARVERILACGGGTEARLPASATLAYRSLPVPGQALEDMVLAVHNEMRSGEAALAQELAGGDHLVFVDGPLAVMRPGPQEIVGVIKAHHRRYLSGDDERVVSELGCGQRTPLFTFGGVRSRYSWYVRLCRPGGETHGWHGIVRCESPAAIPVERVAVLADASAAALPAFASLPGWDPRAPQNLVPVAGLEKRLRHLLGERDLVLRMVRSAAPRANAGGLPAA